MRKLNLKLVGLDGNAFFLLGSFITQAKKEKWPQEKIEKITTEARSKDYNHLLATLSLYCKNGGI